MARSDNIHINFSASTAAVSTDRPVMEVEPGEITFAVAANDDGAVASAEMRFLGEVFYASASTKRRPGERSNIELAKKLAAARVLEKVVKRVRKQADGLLKHEEDVREGRILNSKNSGAKDVDKVKWNNVICYLSESGNIERHPAYLDGYRLVYSMNGIERAWNLSSNESDLLRAGYKVAGHWLDSVG